MTGRDTRKRTGNDSAASEQQVVQRRTRGGHAGKGNAAHKRYQGVKKRRNVGSLDLELEGSPAVTPKKDDRKTGSLGLELEGSAGNHAGNAGGTGSLGLELEGSPGATSGRAPGKGPGTLGLELEGSRRGTGSLDLELEDGEEEEGSLGLELE